MTKIINASVAVLLLSIFVFQSTVFADQYVNGYRKRNGTYVNGYHRSDSDSNFDNNYSSSGNYNPYTGKRGYKKRNSLY